MKGFNPAAAFVNEVRKFMSEVRDFIQDYRQFKQEMREFKQEMHEFKQEVTLKLDQVLANQEYLISELSRFKGDSDSLLVSIFGYCHITGYRASQGEMKHMGAKASRFSRKFGYHMSKTQDPRFGEVGLYDPELLRDLFPVNESDEDVND